MCTHTYLIVPISAIPTDYGWVEIDNKYELTWFTGNQLPRNYNSYRSIFSFICW